MTFTTTNDSRRNLIAFLAALPLTLGVMASLHTIIQVLG